MRSYQQSGGRRPRGLMAGDDEALSRPGHGDIEQAGDVRPPEPSRASARAAATASASSIDFLAQARTGGSPGRGDESRMSFGSCRASGPPHESGRKTIGASSPLLAWTVNTRTPSVSTSMSRLISTSIVSTLGEKIMQRRRLALLMRQSQGQEFVDRIGGFGPEPADQRSPAAILPEQQRIKSKRVKAPSPARAIFRAGARLRRRRLRPRLRAPRRANRSVAPQVS